MRLTTVVVTYASDLRDVEGTGAPGHKVEINPDSDKVAVTSVALRAASAVKILAVTDMAATDLASPTTTRPIKADRLPPFIAKSVSAPMPSLIYNPSNPVPCLGNTAESGPAPFCIWADQNISYLTRTCPPTRFWRQITASYDQRTSPI